jgi:hypothetical protein
MGTKRVMKLVDPTTGKMECKVCGSEHYAHRKPGGHGQFYRGSWQCFKGCKIDKDGNPIKEDD